MDEKNEKTPERVSDEDYKVEPTSADQEIVNKQQRASNKKEQATGENYDIPMETKVKEELKEGVE